MHACDGRANTSPPTLPSPDRAHERTKRRDTCWAQAAQTQLARRRIVPVQGLIRSDGSGLATFNVQYTCMCMRLWPEEVVDAEVEQVTSYGIRCKVGPFRIFVSEKVCKEIERLAPRAARAAGASSRDLQCAHIMQTAPLHCAGTLRSFKCPP